METRTPVQAVQVDLSCDECHAGSMIAGQEAQMCNPPRYIHKCDNCGVKKWVSGGKKYPRIEYEYC